MCISEWQDVGEMVFDNWVKCFKAFEQLGTCSDILTAAR